MKIEKLTENKIRVIIHPEELGLSNVNLHNIVTRSIETQDVFLDILKKAEEEFDFCTDGYKLLIEAFSSLEDTFVFTITKYLPDSNLKKKKLVAKRKSFNKLNHDFICCFEDFELFCEFCSSIKNLHKSKNGKPFKDATLYLWKNNYYLILKNLNPKYETINLFYATVSEFGKLLSFSNHFESKLLEHGKVLIKKNAIDVGIRFFTK